MGGGPKVVLNMLELACARGQKGPLGIRIPNEHGGTKREGKGRNKTQAVVLYLIKRL